MIRRWWNAYRRQLDIRILWPSVKRGANGDLDLARAAFYYHTGVDPAWADLDPNTIHQIISELS